MNTRLTVVAKIVAKENQVDFLKEKLMALITPTRNEDGCIQYDLHQDQEDPRIFLFYENWENKDLWLAHLESKHMEAYKTATKDAVEVFELHQMSMI